MKTKCVIGIDGGASSTKAALIDEGMRIIADSRGGPADHFSAPDGKQRLEKALSEAILPLLACLKERAGLFLSGIGLGLTGVSIPGKRQAAVESLSRILMQVEIDAADGLTTAIENDAVAAWAGALAGEDGVVVIGGTGSIAFGRRGDSEIRIGGFGYMFGDEGGGFRIACQAIKAGLRGNEGLGPKTSLSESVSEFFGVQNVRQVPGRVYSENIAVEEIATMCPLVFREAERGDEVARQIVEEAGRSLAELGVAALKGLTMTDGTISYVGGVFSGGEPILRSFRERINRELPDARVVTPKHSSVVGAGILALRSLASRERI